MNLNKFISERVKSYLNESKQLNCVPIELNSEVISYIKKFKSSEDLLRSGGLPTEILDRLAFGFSSDDIKTLNPKQLKIKWKDDLENVKFELNNLAKKSGESLLSTMKSWANNVDLTTPIDVSYEKNGFYIEDGHHRYFAAKLLGKSLNVNLEIKMNPIVKISPSLSYDDFHRCIFNQVQNQ